MVSYKETGIRVLHEEIDALRSIEQFINSDTFSKACSIILNTVGKIIVMGMGKSGHIGSKIAATLASTGTPSFFVHPAEAAHGDLGMISKDDTVIAISNSGESSEIMVLIPVLKRLGIKIICITGKEDSTMAKEADVHICIHVKQEACPLNLAPTSSTTATLVMGDAIAIALLEARGFSANDFALSHPGGALGKKLLLRVSNVMHEGDELPCVDKYMSIKNALFEITSKGLGMAAVTDQSGKLYGVFTDGDLRRVIDKGVTLDAPVCEVIKEGCITVAKEMMAAEALRIMQSNKINGLIVVDSDNKVVGAFNMHDLLKVGVF